MTRDRTLTCLLLLCACWCLSVSDSKRVAYTPPKTDEKIPDTNEIEVVHVVFMNHLDVGYNGIPVTGFVYNVLNRYFDIYFPLAIETSNTMRQSGFHYIYTTHPWLVSMYVDCPPGMNLHCPNETALDAFTKAVNRGDITWHAGPFNQQSEILSPDLFEYGISISHDLDVKFGKNLTATMSQRDVPGLTRSVIPLLNKMGIQAISLGVNSLSAPPAVPKAFVWQDQQSDTDLIFLFHPFGYGGTNTSDCVIVPSIKQALAVAVNDDNAGPQTSDEVFQILSQLESEFPAATIVGSTFDAFVQVISTVKDSLPVVQSEIGDTWIHGVASDPLKLAAFREVQRARTACLQSQICDPNEYSFKNFSRFLVKVAEHTWGLTSSGLFRDIDVDFLFWSNDLFEDRRSDLPFQNMESSWFEQRAFISNGIAALGDSKMDLYLKADIQNRLLNLKTVKPDTNGFINIKDLSTMFDTGRFNISFDSTGAIVTLLDKVTSRNWASSLNPVAQLVYQTFDETDFDDFLAEYSPCQALFDRCEFSLDSDFGKPGLFIADPSHQTATASLQSLYVNNDTSAFHFLLELAWSDNTLVSYYGAPAFAWVQIDVPLKAGEINVTLQWFNKTTTRLPESIWLTFNPIQQEDSELSWWLDKMSEWISPLEVLHNGSQHLHAIESGAVYSSVVPSSVRADQAQFVINSLDAALLCVGDPNPFPVPLTSPDVDRGVSFGLYNNIWDTNYILWYPYTQEDANTKFRFSITVQ